MGKPAYPLGSGYRPPDVVVFCEGTIAHPHSRYVVQVARYLRSRDVWVLVRRKATQIDVNDDGSAGWSFDESVHRIHGTWRLTCAVCGADSPVRDEALQQTLDDLVHRDLTTVPLVVFDGAVQHTSKMRAKR